jgi:hypothetical protein
MKKLVIFLMVLVVASVVIPRASHAASTDISITGHVYDARDPFIALSFSDVEVTCQGISRHYTATPLGDYLVTFTSAECPQGSTVKVAVVDTDRGVSGSTWVTLHGLVMKVNIAAIPTLSVPEFGWAQGMFVAGAGIATIAYSRRYMREKIRM